MYEHYKKYIKWNSNKGAWYFSFYHNNRRIYRSSVKWTKSKVYLAQDALKEICKNLDSITKNAITLNEVFDEYIVFKSLTARSNTILTQKRVFNKQFREKIGKFNINDITVKHINSLFYDIITMGDNGKLYSNNSISKFQTLLNQVFRYAYINDYSNSNIMEKVPKFKHNRVEKKFSRRSVNFNDVIAVINSIDNIMYKVALSISLFTGMRPSEIFALNFEDDKTTYFEISKSYSHETQEISPPKNNQIRDVPIPTQLRKILDDYYTWLKGQEYDKSSPLIGVVKRTSKTSIDRSINKSRNELKIEKFSWYDIRSTLITKLLENGADPYIVAKTAGHDQAQTTDTYAQVSIEQQTKILNILANQNKKIDTISIPI